jgi:hypothetical protein
MSQLEPPPVALYSVSDSDAYSFFDVLCIDSIAG